jgi:hypothetical protein
VRGLDLIPERRAPQHALVGAATKQIREIRMTVGKLPNYQFPREINEMIPQKGCQPGNVELFPLSDGTRFFRLR